MGGCNECAVGAVATINEKRIPTIALAAVRRGRRAGRRTAVRVQARPRTPPTAPPPSTAELRRSNIRKVGVLHSDDDYGQEGLTALRGELDKAGIKLLGAEAVKHHRHRRQPARSGSWSTRQAGRAGRLDPAGAGDAGRHQRPAGQVPRVDSSSTRRRPATSSSARRPGATEQATLIFTQTMVIDDVIATTPAKAARRQWFQDYTARFGGYNGSSSFAADAVQLIADAELRAGGEPGQVDRDGSATCWRRRRWTASPARSG